MVFLAITADGLSKALHLSEKQPLAVWCGADAISEVGYISLHGRGVTRFVYPLGGQPPEVLAGALDTIAEHHPNELVWVERESQAQPLLQADA